MQKIFLVANLIVTFPMCEDPTSYYQDREGRMFACPVILVAGIWTWVPCWLMKQEEVTQPLQGEALAASGKFPGGSDFPAWQLCKRGLEALFATIYSVFHTEKRQ